MATNTTKLREFTPLGDNIFVTELEEGMLLTRRGIILTDDNFKDTGIRPRWGRVWRTGPEVDAVKPDEWVLVEHGRWTLRIPMEFESGEKVDVWKIDPAAILLVHTGKERPTDTSRYRP